MLQIKCAGESLEREVDSPRLSVGRDASNDIVLSDASVSGFHGVFHYESGVLSFVDLGSTNGSFIGGAALTGKVELPAWSRLRLGSVELEVTDPSARRPTQVSAAIDVSQSVEAPAPAQGARGHEDAPSARLIPLSDGPVQSAVEIAGQLDIGRDAGNALAIQDPHVSGAHARIVFEDGRFVVHDKGSSNGTFVDGVKVTTKPLKDGSRIAFDRHEFLLRIDSTRETAESSAVSLKRNTVVREQPAGAVATPADDADNAPACGDNNARDSQRRIYRQSSQDKSPAFSPRPAPNASAVSEQGGATGTKPPFDGAETATHQRSAAGQEWSLGWLLLSRKGRLGQVHFAITAFALLLVGKLPELGLVFSDPEAYFLGVEALRAGQITPAAASFSVMMRWDALLGLLLFWPLLVVFIKRFHDLGLSGWWLLLGSVVAFGLLSLGAGAGVFTLVADLVVAGLLALVPGNSGPNKFGKAPVKP